MIVKLLLGLAVMIFLWAVQLQAAEVPMQNDIIPARHNVAPHGITCTI